eukprot:tig00000411_g547.t1
MFQADVHAEVALRVPGELSLHVRRAHQGAWELPRRDGLADCAEEVWEPRRRPAETLADAAAAPEARPVQNGTARRCGGGLAVEA